jgi:8-oxo-dGTP diphosphatase
MYAAPPVEALTAARDDGSVPRRYFGPALAVDAVWVRGERVLLVRRGRPPFRGLWALPGGFVELRETVEHAVVRELREETGLRGTIDGLVGVYSGPNRDPRKPNTSVVFLIRGRGGRPRGGDDAADARWVPLGEVREMAFDHREILSDALRALRRPHRHRSRRARA